MKNVASDDCDLDHVVPLSSSTDNSYRNIVVACFNCNKTKRATHAPDFLRGLYRSGRLSEEEFDDRLSTLEMLQNGELKPLGVQ
jgi:5-methylcytosine-specific restriction endonuclease McrA